MTTSKPYPSVKTRRQVHDEECRYDTGGANPWDVRRCRHGYVQVVRRYWNSATSYYWDTLNPIDTPILYFRAWRVVRRDSK